MHFIACSKIVNTWSACMCKPAETAVGAAAKSCGTSCMMKTSPTIHLVSQLCDPGNRYISCHLSLTVCTQKATQPAITLEKMSFHRVWASRVNASEQERLSGRHCLHWCTKSTASWGVMTCHSPLVPMICSTRQQHVSCMATLLRGRSYRSAATVFSETITGP